MVCTRFLLPLRPQVHRYALSGHIDLTFIREKISSTMADPVALARRGRPPPKVRVAAPTTPRESPPQGAKDKANERIAAQLAGPDRVPVAQVVH